MIHKVDKATGTVIRRLRETAGVTQHQLGRMLSVSYQQLQKYESGENRVSISRFFEIAEALGIKPVDFMQLVMFEVYAQEKF